MRLSICLSVVVIILLSGCKGVPVEPEMIVYRPVIIMKGEQIDWDNSYWFGTSDIDPNNPDKQTRVPFFEFVFKVDPVATSPEQYGAKVSWGVSVREWGEKNCRAQQDAGPRPERSLPSQPVLGGEAL